MIVACLFVCTATTVHAQSPGATRTVKVTLTGPLECLNRIPKTINVVIDGNETESVYALRQGDRNEWRGELADNAKPIRVNGTRASLRLGGLRTNCETSVRKNEGDAGIASFRFKCIPRPARSVEFQIDPQEKPIGYVRGVSKSADCTDWAILDSGSTIVEDIWPSEEVRLLFGSHHDRDAQGVPRERGLLVLSPTESEALLTFSKPIERVATRGVGTRRLDNRDRIVLALSQQRAMGDGTVPQLSPTAIDIDTKLLDEAGVESLLIKVK